MAETRLSTGLFAPLSRPLLLFPTKYRGQLCSRPQRSSLELRQTGKPGSWRHTTASSTPSDSTCAYRQTTQVAHDLTTHRNHSYDRPPIDDITIEEFETFALDRLRVLAEIESSFARNRTFKELSKVIETICEKYLPLNATSAEKKPRDEERRKDHIGHFVLRLAFCRS